VITSYFLKQKEVITRFAEGSHLPPLPLLLEKSFTGPNGGQIYSACIDCKDHDIRYTVELSLPVLLRYAYIHTDAHRSHITHIIRIVDMIDIIDT
jgi:hypothetical protein